MESEPNTAGDADTADGVEPIAPASETVAAEASVPGPVATPAEVRASRESTGTPTATADAVGVGWVGKPHGLDGSFYVGRPNADLLREAPTLIIEGVPHRVARHAGTDERPIVRLDGCRTREDAEALRRAELMVPRTSLPALEDGAYWAHELEGCEVVDGDRPVGTVQRLMVLPSCEVLEVGRPDGEDLLVPLVKDAVRSVDVPARRIDVSLAFLGVGGSEGANAGQLGRGD